MSAKRGATVRSRRSPASVGATFRVVRVRSRIPSFASRLRIVWLRADCDTPSFVAARVKLRSSATATKATRSLKLSPAIYKCLGRSPAWFGDACLVKDNALVLPGLVYQSAFKTVVVEFADFDHVLAQPLQRTAPTWRIEVQSSGRGSGGPAHRRGGHCPLRMMSEYRGEQLIRETCNPPDPSATHCSSFPIVLQAVSHRAQRLQTERGSKPPTVLEQTMRQNNGYQISLLFIDAAVIDQDEDDGELDKSWEVRFPRR